MRPRLAEVRKALQKSSPRSLLLRGGYGLTLDALRNEVISRDEVVVDFNLFPDRMVVGVISKEDARYFQFDANPRRLTKGFCCCRAGFANSPAGTSPPSWGMPGKKVCRRLHRILLGRLTSFLWTRRRY